MCYDDHAQPPVAPGATGTAEGEDLVLKAADGTEFMAYFAHPTSGAEAQAQVLIFPDVRGLHQFYKDLAVRFAEAGITALALDYFGRTAGIGSRDESFEFWPHVQQFQLDGFWQDVQAGLNYLQDKPGTGKVFVTGFCMGGSVTLMTGTQAQFGFVGLMPFYASLKREFGGQGTVLDNAQKIAYPILGQCGGADQGIPVTDVEELKEKLNEAGVENDIKIYDGAPHSFFDRRSAEHAEASEDAWHRMLSFIATRAA